MRIGIIVTIESVDKPELCFDFNPHLLGLMSSDGRPILGSSLSLCTASHASGLQFFLPQLGHDMPMPILVRDATATDTAPRVALDHTGERFVESDDSEPSKAEQ